MTENRNGEGTGRDINSAGWLTMNCLSYWGGAGKGAVRKVGRHLLCSMFWQGP